MWQRLPSRFRPRFHWIFIGAAQQATPTHIDPTLTHAWLTQIRGRKRFILFPPCNLHACHDPASGEFVDPLAPDLGRFPNYTPELGVTVVIQEGETLFVPCNWAHHVTCLDDSVSLTYNFLPKKHFSPVRQLFLMRAGGRAHEQRGTRHNSSS